MRYALDSLYKIKEIAKKQLLGTITHVRTRDNVVAFSFDDGPHPESTPAILNTLKKYNARATFFMVGKSAFKYPELVLQIAKAGHAIGNHSWAH